MDAINNISIRNKLIIIQSVTAFIALLICCSIFAFIGVRSFETAAVRKTYSIARILGANSVSPLQFLDQEAANKILEKLNNEMDIQEAVLFDRSGRVFSKYSRLPQATVDTSLLHASEGLNYKSDFGIADPNFLVRYKIMQANELLGTLFIKVRLTSLRNIIISYVIASGLVLFAGLISALVASFFLQRTISHRLLLLVDKTKEVAQTGNYSHPVVYKGQDEIAILSKEFNNMLVQIDTMKSSLNEINLELEERVDERTAELEAANKEMEAFSYTVSHDLKAPLRAINGFTDILVSKYNDKLDDKGRELTRVIVANAKKMGGLIEDLLEFSRIGRKELIMTEVPMDEVVEQVLVDARNMYSNRNEEVTVGALPNAKGDKSLLVQVWANLIFNAFKYTGHKELTKIEIGSYREDDQVVYYIKDNGAGFDMKYEDKLFKVFQRLHGANEFEGTGVGLANVHRIVTRHGGKVWAKGEVDKGASFYFSLPT